MAGDGSQVVVAGKKKKKLKKKRGPFVCAPAGRVRKGRRGCPDWVSSSTWSYLAGTRRAAGICVRPSRERSGERAAGRARKARPTASFNRTVKLHKTHPKVHSTGGDGRLTSLGEDSSTATTPRRRHATSESQDRQPCRHEEVMGRRRYRAGRGRSRPSS